MPHIKGHTYLPEEVIKIYRDATGFTGTDWEAYEEAKIQFSNSVEKGIISEINPFDKGPEGEQFIEKKSTEEPN